MTTLLPGYLGCLSTNPLIDESVHDRSFFALAANVVPVADSNAFSRRHMAGLERYAFRFEPQSIRAAVEALLAGPEQALEHTEAAWRALDPVFAMRESLRRLAVYARMVATNARCAPDASVLDAAMSSLLVVGAGFAGAGARGPARRRGQAHSLGATAKRPPNCPT
ncbi:MAG: hypothetical protein IPO58_25075 [Betaproteobacteria bacterium]|nr:hypothetical protein [Betaproteobacteria bacterium]